MDLIDQDLAVLELFRGDGFIGPVRLVDGTRAAHHAADARALETAGLAGG